MQGCMPTGVEKSHRWKFRRLSFVQTRLIEGITVSREFQFVGPEGLLPMLAVVLSGEEVVHHMLRPPTNPAMRKGRYVSAACVGDGFGISNGIIKQGSNPRLPLTCSRLVSILNLHLAQFLITQPFHLEIATLPSLSVPRVFDLTSGVGSSYNGVNSEGFRAFRRRQRH
jgi:hypothetical protein